MQLYFLQIIYSFGHVQHLSNFSVCFRNFRETKNSFCGCPDVILEVTGASVVPQLQPILKLCCSLGDNFKVRITECALVLATKGHPSFPLMGKVKQIG